MSISGAVLICVTILVRTAAINRLPCRTWTALWVIVLIRLLVPVSIPSEYSVFCLLADAGISDSFRHPAQERQSGDADGKLADTVEQNARSAAVKDAGSHTPEKNRKADSRRELLPEDLPEILWAAGFLVCAMTFGVLYLSCRRRFAESLPVEHEFAAAWLREHKIRRPIQIRRSGRVNVPLTYGICRPVILMPGHTDWKNERHLAYIFAHEYVHIRRFYMLTKILLAAAVSVHWFNPLVWIFYILFNRDLELSCDETVIHTMADSSRSEYAQLLISMEEQKVLHAPLCSSFCKNQAEERIIAIMKIKKISIKTGILAAVLVAGMTTLFATSATASGESHGESIPSLVAGKGTEKRNDSDTEKKTEAGAGTRADSLSGTTEEKKENPDESVSAPVLKKYGGSDTPARTQDQTDTSKAMALRIYEDEKFKDYKKYGLSYDEKTGYLMYKGQKVGYFKDEWGPQTYTMYSDEGGDTGIIVLRDKDYKITGLEETSIPFIFDEPREDIVLSETDREGSPDIQGACVFEGNAGPVSVKSGNK